MDTLYSNDLIQGGLLLNGYRGGGIAIESTGPSVNSLDIARNVANMQLTYRTLVVSTAGATTTIVHAQQSRATQAENLRRVRCTVTLSLGRVKEPTALSKRDALPQLLGDKLRRGIP